MLLDPINPKAVRDTDFFLVLKQDGTDWRVVEGQPTKEAAEKAVSILHEHDPKHLYGFRERLAWTPSYRSRP